MRRFGKRHKKTIISKSLPFQEHAEALRCIVRKDSNVLFGEKRKGTFFKEETIEDDDDVPGR